MNIGVIGGSGLYKLTETGESLEIKTPFGEPSDKIRKAQIGENTVFFVPRHGEGHRLLPSEINYRANIFALKRCGVSHVISISAVGSMKAEIEPGHFVLPNQYLDRTKGIRKSTFFGDGIVGHVPFADPTCTPLRNLIAEKAKSLGVTVHNGGTYVCMEGPQFSTRAESHWYRTVDKVDVIGMTALPEAKLAREAGMCYQTVAMSTDYDCWNEEDEAVSWEAIMKVMHNNVETSRELTLALLSSPFPSCLEHNGDAVRRSVVTQEAFWPDERREVLSTLFQTA